LGSRGEKLLDGLQGGLLGSRLGGLASHLSGGLLGGLFGGLPNSFQHRSRQRFSEGLEYLARHLGSLQGGFAGQVCLFGRLGRLGGRVFGLAGCLLELAS
jgi:hypothetical protein